MKKCCLPVAHFQPVIKKLFTLLHFSNFLQQHYATTRCIKDICTLICRWLLQVLLETNLTTSSSWKLSTPVTKSVFILRINNFVCIWKTLSTLLNKLRYSRGYIIIKITARREHTSTILRVVWLSEWLGMKILAVLLFSGLQWYRMFWLCSHGLLHFSIFSEQLLPN